MANYAKPLPRDTGLAPMQEYPAPFVSNEQYTNASATASSVISFTQDTSTIEVGAFGGQGAVIRWVPASETAAVSPYASVISSGLGANYDHYIPPSTVRRFVVPKESVSQGQVPGGIQSVYGLYRRLAVNSAGATVSSVLVIEY